MTGQGPQQDPNVTSLGSRGATDTTVPRRAHDALGSRTGSDARLPLRASARAGISTHRWRLDRALALQFLKFGVVGVSNTLITLAVYTLLVKVFGVWYIAASAIGFAVGAVNGFLLNRRWTFSGHVGDMFTPLRWLVVQGSGLLLNVALVYLFVSQAGLDKLLGQACATAIVVVLTFLANRSWTFRVGAAGAE
jgi:putative flippase GtrA